MHAQACGRHEHAQALAACLADSGSRETRLLKLDGPQAAVCAGPRPGRARTPGGLARPRDRLAGRPGRASVRMPDCEARSPAVEVQWWWPILERDAGVDAGDGGGDPSALSTGQSSAAVPVGRLSRAWGAGRGRGGGGSSERRPGRNTGVNASLPNLFEASQFTLRGIKLDTLPSPALLPQSITTNAYHCQFRVLARL